MPSLPSASSKWGRPMPDVMPADELRAAADLLRERAGKATPGKWIAFGTSIASAVGQCTCADPGSRLPHEQYCGLEGPVAHASEEDTAYIATTRPCVGEILAKWLNDYAERAGRPYYQQYDDMHHALAVARAILGTDTP
jgi:hypothetical protein